MALLDTQVSVLANQAMNYLVSGETPRRLGNTHPNIAPYQTFAVLGGWVIVAVGNDGQFRKLCQLLALPALPDDPRFRSNADRVAHRGELTAALAPALSQREKEELLTAFATAGVPAGPINTVAGVFADPQVVARGMQLNVGGVPAVASPIVIDGKRQVSDRPSPALGSGGGFGGQKGE
jgi:crotonobetainyl-CoA:carnitine CoA-transferase CaiB-like acyl-CoA transferase